MKVLVLGATSGMTAECLKLLAAEGAELFLVARNGSRLEAVAKDLRVRGALKVETREADLTAIERHSELFNAALDSLGELDTVLVAYGSLPDQELCQNSFLAAQEALACNFVSVVSWLTLASNWMYPRKRGTIAVISSVAGDRGRQSNYVYGSAKGALSTFLEGLRQRLFKEGIRVVTIKPGWVDTPMTTNVKKGPLFVSAETAGRLIHRALKGNRDIVYVPSFWRAILGVICVLPECIFKRIKL